MNNLPEITFSSGLPSNNLVYPDNFSVKYRPYTFGELSYFSQSTGSLKDIVNKILDGITTEGIDKKDLTFADFMFVALLRKLASYDSEVFVVEYTCSSDKCKKKGKVTIQPKSLDFDDLKVPKFPIILPVSDKVDLHFQPLTVKGYLELIELKGEDDSVSVLSKSVSNMEFSKAKDIIDGAGKSLIDSLNIIDNHLYHGLKKIKAICSACKAVSFLSLEGEDTFIYPFRKPTGTPGTTIRFGV